METFEQNLPGHFTFFEKSYINNHFYSKHHSFSKSSLNQYLRQKRQEIKIEIFDVKSGKDC